MNKLLKFGIFSLLMSVAFYGWSGACKPIAMSCMQNGYYKGGDKHGKGLIKDCVLPVTAGKKKLPNTNFSEHQLRQCKKTIGEKVKGKVKAKMEQKVQEKVQQKTQQQ